MENKIKGKLMRVIRKNQNKAGAPSEVISATRLVARKHPEVVPAGYWIADDAIVIKTRRRPAYRKALVPAMYAVTETGEVLGLTPMVYHLDNRDMKKIPRRSLHSK